MKAVFPANFPVGRTAQSRAAHSAAGWSAFRRGLVRSLPVSVGYFPVALAFGIAASETGVPCWAALFMSLTTYGGTAQMLAVGLIASGQSTLTVVLAVLVINLRFFLLSMAISEKVAHWPPFRRALFGTYFSDEAFALLVSGNGMMKRRFRSMECLGLVLGPAVVWLMATYSGFAAASHMGELKRLGLDFALIALLLTVLSTQVREPAKLLVAVVAGVISLMFHALHLSTLAIIGTTVVAPFAGLWLQKRLWIKKQKAAALAMHAAILPGDDR